MSLLQLQGWVSFELDLAFLSSLRELLCLFLQALTHQPIENLRMPYDFLLVSQNSPYSRLEDSTSQKQSWNLPASVKFVRCEADEDYGRARDRP
jgi:hypothetical protein